MNGKVQGMRVCAVDIEIALYVMQKVHKQLDFVFVHCEIFTPPLNVYIYIYAYIYI